MIAARARFCIAVVAAAVFAAAAHISVNAADMRVSEPIVTGGTITMDLYVTDSNAFSGVEFGLKLSDEKSMRFISFTQGDAVKSAIAAPFLTRRGTHYFGFYNSVNAYVGEVMAGTLTFELIGGEIGTVTFTEVSVIRVNKSGAVSSEQLSSAAHPKMVLTLDLYAGANSHVSYISGYPDGSFRPSSKTTRAEAAAMLFALSRDASKRTPASNPFKDVPAGAWYENAVTFCAGLGLFEGLYEGSFQADTPVTRGEFVTMTCRFAGAGTAGSIFTDYKPTQWDYIHAAADKGWIVGYPDGAFRPNAPITRAETTVVLNKAMERGITEPPKQSVAYADVPPGHWAYLHVAEAVTAHRFVTGDDGREIWIE